MVENVKWLVKSEEETDESFGKRPGERTIEEAIENAVIIVDKHSGPTSHQITAWVKNIFGVSKAGHTGTLDPAVTGVLLVALGNATKAMPALMGLDKEYVGVMYLHKEVDESALRGVIQKFVGKIKQVPPLKSAVSRKPREREVYFFDLLEMGGIDRRDVLFKVGCEAGTYIRKICHDVGIKLGVGAHMTELHRTKAGSFSEQQAHSLIEVKDAYEFWRVEGDETRLREILIPVEYAMPHIKKVFVKDSAIHNIACGAPVYVSGITRLQEGIVRGELVAIYSIKEELVALGIAKMNSKEMYERKRGSAVRTDRVFIGKDVYPKM